MTSSPSSSANDDLIEAMQILEDQNTNEFLADEEYDGEIYDVDDSKNILFKRAPGILKKSSSWYCRKYFLREIFNNVRQSLILYQ